MSFWSPSCFMWMALHKEHAESDPEGSVVLPNISSIPNYSPFDFLKENFDSNYDKCE